MIIELLNLEKSPFDFEVSFDAEAINLESETVKLIDEVEVKATLTKHIMKADVEGEIFAEAKTECSRCLTQITEDLRIPFEVSYVEPENYPQAQETELNEDDLSVAILDDENKIDVKELVREQILLNLPEYIYCKKDCKGLCEICAANRNLIDCKCKEKEIDPRWSALQDLK